MLSLLGQRLERVETLHVPLHVDVKNWPFLHNCGRFRNHQLFRDAGHFLVSQCLVQIHRSDILGIDFEEYASNVIVQALRRGQVANLVCPVAVDDIVTSEQESAPQTAFPSHISTVKYRVWCAL